jgi:CRISPR system Cascade subunit CasB
MWPFYTELNDEGQVTWALQAEHTALTLFAVHQQSRPKPMHVADIGLGRAVRALHTGEKAKFSQDAVNRRFAAAATATSTAELALHLRGLISQLNDIGQALDYSRLVKDLIAWQDVNRISQVRRRWGGDYFVWKAEPDNTPADASV